MGGVFIEIGDGFFDAIMIDAEGGDEVRCASECHDSDESIWMVVN